jgi:ATP-binding cassette subfamily B protein
MHGALAHYRRLMVSYLRPQWPAAVLLAALVCGDTALQLLGPQIVRMFVDTAIAGGAAHVLATAAGLFLAVALARQVVEVAATYVAVQVGQTATDGLRLDLLVHCLRLDIGFHNRRLPGELIERVEGDVSSLAGLFSKLFLSLAGNALVAVGVLVVLFIEDARLGTAFAVAAAATLAVLHPLRGLATPFWQAEREASAALSGFLEERLSGAEELRSCGAVPYALRRLHEVARGQYRRARGAALAGRVMQQTTNALLAATHLAAFVLSAYLLRIDAITIGTVYLVYQYSWSLFNPLINAMYQVQDLQRAAAGLTRIRELLDTRSAIDGAAIDRLPPGPLPVDFENVSFAYPPPTLTESAPSVEAGNGAPALPALRDVSFQLAAGKVLGLLGRTGSGKTTIARLVLRFFDPTAGVVRVGGTDLRSVREEAVRDRVGVVTQDVQLFHATVRDNLTFFDAGVPDRQIVSVLEELQLGTWYRSLPQGLDTPLGAGRGLSAGEAQLLACARVFLRDPSVVILDEASSRLDPATERLLGRAVEKLLRNRTAIVIAHRLATVRCADDILVLDDGRIREFGPRAALAADPASHFAALLRAQLAAPAAAVPAGRADWAWWVPATPRRGARGQGSDDGPTTAS